MQVIVGYGVLIRNTGQVYMEKSVQTIPAVPVDSVIEIDMEGTKGGDQGFVNAGKGCATREVMSMSRRGIEVRRQALTRLRGRHLAPPG